MCDPTPVEANAALASLRGSLAPVENRGRR